MGMKIAGATLCMKGGLLNRTVYLYPMSSSTAVFDTDSGGFSAISMGLSDWTRNNNGRAGNTAVKNFPEPTATLAQPTHVGIANGADEDDDGFTLYWTGTVTGSPAAPVLGASFGFDADALGMTAAAGALTGRGSKACLEEGLVSPGRWLTLHSGNPGTNGANEEGDAISVATGDFRAVSSEANKVENNKILTWGVQNTDLPDLMWVALRDGASSGNVLWADAFDNNPPDPEIGDTISLAVGALKLGVLVDA